MIKEAIGRWEKLFILSFLFGLLLWQTGLWVNGEEADLPDAFDVREQGITLTVRSQGNQGTCWALASVSALEISWQMQGGQSRKFSSEHMVTQNAFTADLSEGGDYTMIMAYLSSWQGPVTEEDTGLFADDSEQTETQSSLHVKEIQELTECSCSQLKQAIYQYGAVQTSLVFSRGLLEEGMGYYNEEEAAFYNPIERTPNHDVVVIGWDDHYPAEKFSTNPEIDGAFLCLNSWGEDFGQAGVFYVSYADANLGKSGLVYTRLEEAGEDQKIYQTDDCGWQGQQGYGDTLCWFGNIYQTEENTAGELLEEFGFYAVGPDTTYELYLVRNFDDETGFSQKQFLQAGKLLQAGYYSIPLEEPVALNPGEIFSVLVKIDTPDVKNPVAVEYRSGSDTQDVTTAGKHGYISKDGEQWEYTEKKYGSNVCLKACTRLVQP